MQVCASPSAQHHDLKRLVPQPSQLLDDAVLTWPLQPWPVHAKRGRKRRHAVYAGELDGQFPMCTPALPLFVGGDGDGQDVGPVQAVFSPESLHEGAAKDGRKRRESPANTDGYSWKKYGEKVLKETGVPRSYYKCSVSGCNAKKYVEYTEDGDVAECIIKGEHNHGRSRTNSSRADGAAPARTYARRRPAPKVFPPPVLGILSLEDIAKKTLKPITPTIDPPHQHGNSSHSDSATPLADAGAIASGTGHNALMDDSTSRRGPPASDMHIIMTPEKPIHSSGLRGSSRRKKRPAQRAHESEDVYALALCDMPPFKLQRQFFTAAAMPGEGSSEGSPRSSCEDASVHREPSVDNNLSTSHCGGDAVPSVLRAGSASVVVNSPPSTPHKAQLSMMGMATPLPLRA